MRLCRFGCRSRPNSSACVWMRCWMMPGGHNRELSACSKAPRCTGRDTVGALRRDTRTTDRLCQPRQPAPAAEDERGRTLAGARVSGHATKFESSGKRYSGPCHPADDPFRNPERTRARGPGWPSRGAGILQQARCSLPAPPVRLPMSFRCPKCAEACGPHDAARHCLTPPVKQDTIPGKLLLLPICFFCVADTQACRLSQFRPKPVCRGSDPAWLAAARPVSRTACNILAFHCVTDDNCCTGGGLQEPEGRNGGDRPAGKTRQGGSHVPAPGQTAEFAMPIRQSLDRRSIARFDTSACPPRKGCASVGNSIQYIAFQTVSVQFGCELNGHFHAQNPLNCI